MAKSITKKSTVAGKIPATVDLEIGELAVNTADALIYVKHNDNTIKVIGDVWARYQLLDNTNGDAPVVGCYVIATGQVYGRKEGTDNSTGKTLRVKIPTGIKVRRVIAKFTSAEVGTTNKQMYVVFDTSIGYSGMPNNAGTSTTLTDFMPPQISCFNGTDLTTAKVDGLPSIIPKFSSDGTNRDFNALLCVSSVNAPFFINILF